MPTVLLEDGSEFMIVDSMEIDGSKFILFSNIDDPTDFCFRKSTIKDGTEVYSALSNKEEFEKVLIKFGLKYEN